jgi:ribosome-associated protein
MEKTAIETMELARHIVNLIADKKGENIVLLDIRGQTLISDYFILCSGNSERQLKAIADGIGESLAETLQIKPRHTEGAPSTGWILMDFADIIVHIFTPNTRAFYDLEGLWSEAQVLLKMQ